MKNKASETPKQKAQKAVHTAALGAATVALRSEEHTSELQSPR